MKRSKTNYLKKSNKKTLIVAIDIGKSVHYGYLRAPNGKEVKPFPIYNGHKSYENFWAKIATCKQSNGIEEVIAGFESTGPYAEPLIHFLATKPVKLLQVNPMHTKRLKELTGNSPHKTDKKDPRVIADIISLGHALSVVVPKGAAAELRRLSQARQRVSKNRTALVNQLHNLIYILFPEYTQVMKKITSKSSLYLLKNHTSPEEIVKCGFDRLQIVLKRVSLGRLKSGQAKALFEAARNTTGIDEGREGLLTEIRHLVSCIEHELAFMDHLENRMNHYLKQIPYSKSMLSIKGIGKITAAGLIGEVGDFRQFRTISEIMKLAGLDLYEISSGIHHGQRHISKRGRSYLRKLLFFVSLNTIRTNGIMHKRYLAMLERGMPKVKAIVAISRRLLRILFALVRNHSSYREDYDHQHSLRLAA
ncbi:MAG: IS110 family transposase [Desulfatiglandales bacterium]